MADAVNRTSYRVIYGDTDQMGVVYYANYLALFERGRCEFMRERAFDYAAFERGGVGFPVVEANVKYRQPARFDDLVTIETELFDASRVTLDFRYRILRGEALLTEGSTRHACVSAAGRPVRLPLSLKPLLPEALHLFLAKA
jgi:acyl-CoA thioester hydrolase